MRLFPYVHTDTHTLPFLSAVAGIVINFTYRVQFTEDVDVQAVEAFTTERASGAISCEGDSRRLQSILLAQRDSENESWDSPSTSLTRADIRYLEDTCRSYSTSVAVTILEHGKLE